MPTRSRVPFKIRGRLAFDYPDNVSYETLLAARTLTEYDGQCLVLDPGGADRVVTLWNDSAADTNGLKAPRGVFVDLYNVADGNENLTVQPVIGETHIDLATNPTATNTLTIAGLVFEFLAAAATVANDAYIGVLRASTAAATLQNLVDAINGDVAEATGILNSLGAQAYYNNATVPFRAGKVGTYLVVHYAGSIGGQPTSGCSLDLSTNPTATNTVTIGADIYEFLAAGATVAAPGNIGVIRAGTAAATLANLISAINGLTVTANGILDAGVQAAMVGTEHVYAATYAGSLLWIYEADAVGGACASTKTTLALSDALTAAVDWSANNCNIGPASAVSNTLTSAVTWSSSTVVATQTLHTVNRGEFVRVQNAGPCWVVTRATGMAAVIPSLIFDAATELTISAGGAIAVTQSAHTVDTNADAASDNLDTITGGIAEMIAFIRPNNAARTVVIRHIGGGTGNIYTPAGQSISLAEAADWAMLACDGTNWTVVAYSTTAAAGGGLGLALGTIGGGTGITLLGLTSGKVPYGVTNVAAETTPGDLPVVDTNAPANFWTTDTVQGAVDGLKAAIGGTSQGVRAYTKDQVVADNEALVASIDKLDTEWWELTQLGAGSGVTKVGLTTNKTIIGTANMAAEVDPGAMLITDAAAPADYWTTDTIQGGLDGLKAAVGGTSQGVRAYTTDFVVTDNETIVASIDALDTYLSSAADHIITWYIADPVVQVDGDGVYTNGGGLMGQVPTVTIQTAAFAVAYDHGTTTYVRLSRTNTDLGAQYAAEFQVYPDAEAENDACYFGGVIPFCEIGFDVSATVATYGADSCVWEYWNGAAWVALPVNTFSDTTATAPLTGVRPFTQDGAMTFLPPADWAASDITATGFAAQTAYWIRSRVTAGPNITQIPILSDEHALVTGEEGLRMPHKGTLKAITVTDQAATLHTAADSRWVLYDSITGACRSISFAQDRRQERIDITDWNLTTAARLSLHCYQDDGTNEVVNPILLLEYSYTK